MSFDHSAVIVFGLPKDEIGLERDGGYYDEDGLLQLFPTYYDGSNGIVGIDIHQVDSNYLEIPQSQDISDAVQTFKRLTGKDGRLYLSTYSY